MKLKDLHSELPENILKTGVYIIYLTNKPNYFYVGSGSTIKSSSNKVGIEQRWFNHFSTLKRNKHYNKYLQRSVNKYGIENLRFKIIELCSPEECINIEQKWLQYYITNFKVYNLNKVNPNRLGVKLNQKTKNKIGKANSKLPVYQFDFNGNLIKVWDSVSQAEKHFNNGKIIYKCVQNKSNTAYGYIWSYSKEFSFKSYNNSKKIRQYDLEGNLVKEWFSITEAAKFYKVQGSSISICCRENYRTCCGFKWSYATN
jgi:group I intron endonuclease